ncbi:hypothetical protein VTK73DRAFT_5315 [Phialemonium thermophilum]|uniref:Uncharacterized protein n=1 Tax=Phialemonium thermophilum TaxID=223376 RepID=A0ABR3Y922_9PEZI
MPLPFTGTTIGRILRCGRDDMTSPDSRLGLSNLGWRKSRWGAPPILSLQLNYFSPLPLLHFTTTFGRPVQTPVCYVPSPFKLLLRFPGDVSMSHTTYNTHWKADLPLCSLNHPTPLGTSPLSDTTYSELEAWHQSGFVFGREKKENG